MRRLLPFVFLLSGCAAKSDGSWVIFYSLKSETPAPEEPNPYIGYERQMMGNLYRTGEETILDIGEILLVGTSDKEGFSLSSSNGTQVTGSDCELYSESEDVEAEGTWTEDLGFEGEIRVSSSTKISGCEPAGDDMDETETQVYSMTGIKLDPNDGVEPMHWGYAPFQDPGGY